MKDLSADDPREKLEDDRSSTDDYLSKKEPASLRARIAAAAALILIPLIYFFAAVIGLLVYGYALVSHAAYAVGGSDSAGYVQIARSILKWELVQLADAF